METIICKVNAAIEEGNPSDVALLLGECSNVDFYKLHPVIKAAFETNDFEMIKLVLNYALSRCRWHIVQNAFQHYVDFMDKPIAAKIVTHCCLSPANIIIDNEILTRSVEQWMIFLKIHFKRRRPFGQNCRPRGEARWLMYIMHRSGALSYEDLISEPRLLHTLILSPLKIADFLEARINFRGQSRTVLYGVIMHEGSSYKEKREFIQLLGALCYSQRAAKTILNPDLSELAACAIRNYIKLLKFFIPDKLPLLDVKISGVPTNSSPGGRNISHFFAEYLRAKDYFTFKRVFEPHFDFLTTSDDQGNYSVNEFLRRISSRYPFEGLDFAMLMRAVEVVVRKGDIDKLTFIRKPHIYSADRSTSLFLDHLGFRQPQLSKATGLSTDPVTFPASEISSEFPIHAIPVDLLVLITKEMSPYELLSVFCVSKKCAELKSVLRQSSFWNEFFRAKGPFKNAEFYSVPKEMRAEYIDNQIRHDGRLRRGFLQEVCKMINRPEIKAYDNNWIISGGGINSIEFTNCWNPEPNMETMQMDQIVHSVQILNSTPTDVTFATANMAKRQRKYMYTWSTYKNGEKLSTVTFENIAETFTSPKFHDGKLYLDSSVYNMNEEVPVGKLLAKTPILYQCQDVNRFTGVAVISKSKEWIFYDKSDQLIASVASEEGADCQIRFFDENSFVTVWNTGVSFFDMRSLPNNWKDNVKSPDIAIKNSGKNAVLDSSRQHVILSDSQIRTVWDLQTRRFKSAFVCKDKLIGMNRRYVLVNTAEGRGVLSEFAPK